MHVESQPGVFCVLAIIEQARIAGFPAEQAADEAQVCALSEAVDRFS